MGFWNPRAICPSCGAKIHTHDPTGLLIVKRTGTKCPNCGVALTGKIGLDNKAKLAPPSTAPRGPSGVRIDELERLANLHESGALTDEEFAAAKAELIGTKKDAAGNTMHDDAFVTIYLADAGREKIKVIKIVREVAQLGLREAKRLVDAAPQDVGRQLPQEEAENAKRRLEAVGAQVELK